MCQKMLMTGQISIKTGHYVMKTGNILIQISRKLTVTNKLMNLKLHLPGGVMVGEVIYGVVGGVVGAVEI